MTKCGEDWSDEDATYKEWTCKNGTTFVMDMLPSFCPGCGAKA